LFVEILLLGEILIRAGIQRHVMTRARAEGPASRRFVRLMYQDHRAIRPALADFKAMEVLLHAGLLETQRVDKEPFRLRGLANRKHRTRESAHGDIRANFLGGPGDPLIGTFLDRFELQARRMREADKLLSEALLDSGVRN